MKCVFNEEKQKLNIELDGDIDMETCRSLRTIVDGYMIRYGPLECELNFSEVKFMDSSGLGFIIGRYNLAKMIDCTLTLVNPDNGIKKILALSEIGKTIKVV